eukprot:13593188-Heterocapsa_arctica.AAC.1
MEQYKERHGDITRNRRRERRRRSSSSTEAVEDDMRLKVAAHVVGKRRHRRVCWGLEVLPKMFGFWTKQVTQYKL